MAKVRVHELAKELGITSKDAVAKLQELGEFVRSASSTIEAPVVKKLRDAFPAGQSKPASAPAPQAVPRPAPAAPKPGVRQEAPAAKPAPAAP
ncbi:translation initiation factor IF-2 N-terminal domain-containing protein, partial [Arthrobacter sp. GCM10027362]|uniref:translation initiation factor IF-2 N-terminal domain-containing protein n=1 Tax=Arthrobacter sp. GCM10027362 TaxID=3273379 RepID=UPI00362CED23